MKKTGFPQSPYKRKDKYKNIIQFDKNGYPKCEEHGAMNCVEPSRKLWRCIKCGVGVSFGSVESFDKWLAVHGAEKKPTEKQLEDLAVAPSYVYAESLQELLSWEASGFGDWTVSELASFLFDYIKEKREEDEP